MGYQLRPHEMRMLAEQVDLQNKSGSISKSAFLASQIDWHQEDLRQAPLLTVKTSERACKTMCYIFQKFELPQHQYPWN